MMPFGIAVHPGRGRFKVDPLPHVHRLLTVHESQASLVEDSLSRLITTNYRKRERFDTDHTPVRAGRGVPGRETASVRRRPTTVPRELADLVMMAVIDERQRRPRSVLARVIGVTTRELHLAELGSVQPTAVQPIASYFNIDTGR